MPNCLLEMGVSAPHTSTRLPTGKAGAQWRGPVSETCSLPLCAPSPRLEPAPSGCCQPRWACCLFSDMAPRAHFRLCPALRRLGGSFPASRTMAILSGCVGASEEVPGQGALRQPEEDGSTL